MVANKVEKLLVTIGTTASTVAALTAGQYVALVQGKAANTPLVRGDEFQLAVKKVNGQINYSDKIKTNDIISVKLNTYTAPVAANATITLTAINVDSEYVLNIVDKADKEIFQRRQDRRTISVKAVVGDTPTTIASKLVLGVNADPSSTVVATSAAGVVTLTAKTDGADAAGLQGLQHYFEAFMSERDILGNHVKAGVVAYPQKVNFGSGTFAQVKELERTSKGNEGWSLNQTKFPVEIYPTDLVAGRTYDLLTIGIDNNYWSNSTVAGKVDSPIEIVIAVTAGATTALAALFAAFLPAA